MLDWCWQGLTAETARELQLGIASHLLGAAADDGRMLKGRLHCVREAQGHGWAIIAGGWGAGGGCCSLGRFAALLFVLFASGVAADVTFYSYSVDSGPNLWPLFRLQFCYGPGFCMLRLLLHACCLLLDRLLL